MSLKDWLLSWFRRPAPEDDAVYTVRQRLIYSYFDGERQVRADPMELYKRVMAVGPELDIDMKVSRSPSKDAPKAHSEMIAKVRDIFGLKPFEQGGLTQLEALRLLDHFMNFCGVQKKSSSGPATSAGGTSPPTPPTSEGPPPTERHSGSGSTGTGSSSGSPTP